MDISCDTCKFYSGNNLNNKKCTENYPDLMCDMYSGWEQMEKNTIHKITKVCNNIKDLLHYKNNKYGDSALNPKQIFSKLSGEEAIKIRLDDKISRIQNSTELRKNDICDLIGYLVLLCISKGWNTFDEYKD